MRLLIDNSTKKGETVLDPFMGVGGTGVAASQLDRKFIGIEIDKHYYDVAHQRIYGSRKEPGTQMTIEDILNLI